MERFARFCFVPIAKLFPTVGSIPTETLAQAMINVSLRDPQPESTVEIYDNAGIHKESKG